MAYRGPDISAWQGDIDIRALSPQVDFFIFRVYAGSTKDKKVDRNVNLAIECGKPFGLYIYSYALDEEDAREEAQRVIDAANSYAVRPNFLVVDMEDADNYKAKHGMPSNSTLKAICTEECRAFENAGYYAMVYASSSWFNNQLAGLNDFDKWVAHWPTSGGKQKGNATSPDGENADNCGIWQFTSEGRLDGYGEDLDMNYGYKDFIIQGYTPQPTPQPTYEYTFEEFVKDVQRATGATWVDGIPGPDTLKHTITVSRSTNKYHSVVTALERWFKQLGYYDGEIEADYGKTPIFGYGMEEAVKSYQRDRGLAVVDGVITAHANTWKSLLRLM